MNEISFYRYQLNPTSPLGAVAGRGARQGALIRCRWPDQLVGYGDCHPWPEMGDADLQTQLRNLSGGRASFLMEQTFRMARKDAELRATKQNGLAGTEPVRNHYLVSDAAQLNESFLDEIKSNGFTTIKIKIGVKMAEDAQRIAKAMDYSPLTFRLDFNSKGDLSKLESFLASFEANLRQRIEFIEDPFLFETDSWAKASRWVPLAADFEYENIDGPSIAFPPFNVLIIKPARMDVDKAVDFCVRHSLKAVVTSSLDHPVGVVHATLVAARIKKDFPELLLDCGCLSLRSYAPNEFTEDIMTQGPFILKTKGSGVGFDHILERLDWKPIASA